jgi:mRNA deadenylase 3'-5' endonuclease subunit Ccr4
MPPAKHSIVTYNVLSPNLARPSHFFSTPPADLDPETRYQRVLEKLEVEVEAGSIIALQEVSREWASRLCAFFQRNGYTFISTQYGKVHNGYMGVSLAFPNDEYDALDMSMFRVTDTFSFPKKSKPAKSKDVVMAAFRYVWGYIWLLFSTLVQPLFDLYRKFVKQKKPDNFWEQSESRQNVAIWMRLQHRATGETFCVATYHMPCVFWDHRVMAFHASLSANEVIRLSDTDPCIYCGDYNFKPGDASYELLTTGTLASDDPVYEVPDPKFDPDFELAEYDLTLLDSFRSAYKEFNGEEPELTNYALTGNIREGLPPPEPFCDTLDYLFISEGIEVADVLQLPTKDESDGPYPNNSEPSDHLMLKAVVTLPSSSSSSSSSAAATSTKKSTANRGRSKTPVKKRK